MSADKPEYGERLTHTARDEKYLQEILPTTPADPNTTASSRLIVLLYLVVLPLLVPLNVAVWNLVLR